MARLRWVPCHEAVAAAHRRAQRRAQFPSAQPAPPDGQALHVPHGGFALKKSRLVLVGNGMAGVRTLEELLKIAPDLYDITVFGAEPHPNYNRILLSPVLAGEQTIEQIILNPLSWYATMHNSLNNAG